MCCVFIIFLITLYMGIRIYRQKKYFSVYWLQKNCDNDSKDGNDSDDQNSSDEDEDEEEEKSDEENTSKDPQSKEQKGPTKINLDKLTERTTMDSKRTLESQRR